MPRRPLRPPGDRPGHTQAGRGDRAGERAIRELIERHYPDHAIHGEEYGIKEGRSPFTWVLDPVDGTRSFVCGMPTWATLIGTVSPTQQLQQAGQQVGLLVLIDAPPLKPAFCLLLPSKLSALRRLSSLTFAAQPTASAN